MGNGVLAIGPKLPRPSSTLPVKLPRGSVSSTTAVVGIVMQRIDLYLRVITLDCALQIAFKK